jgi:DNA-binding transcriptional MocR family regulator
MTTIQDSSLERELRTLCDRGRVGDRLPSVRHLQRQFAVSPVTVQRVVRRLVMEGRATTRPGDGTFVARPSAPAPAGDHRWQTAILGRAPALPRSLEHVSRARADGSIVLDNGFLDPDLSAHELLGKATARLARRPDAWDRCPTQGLAHLREVFAAELPDAFTADDILITPGAQAALDTVCRVLGRPGDPIVLEDPCYPGALIAAVASGLSPTPVPTDGDGVLPDALADVLARSGARIVILQPRHANPTGSILSAGRRAEVLAIAREFGCFVIEDDWVRDLDLDGPTGPPLAADDDHGHVISIRSLSKAGAPGLRIAAVSGRGPVLQRLISARLGADFFVAPLMQAVAAELLTSPAWQRHLTAVRSTLARRRDVLVDALREHAPELCCVPPRGGVALWCELPAGVDDEALVAECLRRGVCILPGRDFQLTQQTHGAIRLTFGQADIAALQVAAARIGDALSAVRRAR